MEIIVNHQNSILINNEIYVDPLRVVGNKKAKYVFITHPHWDHFSVEDIKKVITNQTKIICPLSMKEVVAGVFDNEVLYVLPEQTYEISNVNFETFHSYNKGKTFHPKSNNWVGYIINIDGERVAIVGDSDATDELELIKTDILLIPIGGTYTMTLVEAAELTNKINPKKVIPTHYGDIVGDKEMGKEFQKLVNKNIVCELQI
jgi:L-ascorbate metabolism protein UlaG (beta-lactamase superfamily)